MNRPREDWPRLASYVVSARLAAGLRDRKALEAASGVTHRTLGKLENGQRVSPDTLAAVEKAIGWKPDSARTVLYGGEPVPLASEQEPGHRYGDGRLQQIWEITGLSEPVRLGMIAFAQSILSSEEEPDGGSRLAG